MIGLRAAVLALLLSVTSAASASIEGIFWDPSVVGEGWTFESQNDVVAITWYRYENGQPAFRTVVAFASYAADGGIQMTGRVYRTTNFTTSTDVGPFAATFGVVNGRIRGAVIAEGITRNLERFNFNYATPVEQYRGVWMFGNSEIVGVSGDSQFALFDLQTSFADDGTPLRWFTLMDGRDGFVYYEEAMNEAVGVVLNPDNTYMLVRLIADDEKGLGAGAIFNSSNQQITNVFWVTAVALANSDGERAALAARLGLQPSGKAARTAPILDGVREAAAKLPR